MLADNKFLIVKGKSSICSKEWLAKADQLHYPQMATTHSSRPQFHSGK
jgi:hypothetical protein